MAADPVPAWSAQETDPATHVDPADDGLRPTSRVNRESAEWTLVVLRSRSRAIRSIVDPLHLILIVLLTMGSRLDRPPSKYLATSREAITR
jgi:hypothetical protein